MSLKNIMNIEYLKKKGFNFLYIISIIFITLVMIRIIILNDLINSISILNEKMEKIEKSEIINDPLKKIRETLEDALIDLYLQK